MVKMTEEARRLAEGNVRLAYKMAWDYIKLNRRAMQRLMWTEDDVVSEAEAALCKAASSYDAEKSSFATYYAHVFNTQMLMAYRRENAVSRAAGLDALRLDAPIRDGEALTVGDTIADKERMEEKVIALDTVRRALEGMSERDRRIVQLHSAGLSQVQISARLGMTQSNVSRRLNVMRRKAV